MSNAALVTSPPMTTSTTPTPTLTIGQSRALEISLYVVGGLMLVIGIVACTRVGAFRFKGLPIGGSLIGFSALPLGGALYLRFTEAKVIPKTSYAHTANWEERYTPEAAFDHATGIDGEWIDSQIEISVLQHAKKALEKESFISGTLTVNVNGQQIDRIAFTSLDNLLSDLKPPAGLTYPFTITYKFDLSPKIIYATQEITQDKQTHLKMTITIEN